jgi:hypothetical protein
MKKKVILLAAMFAGATCFAQDLTSKKGETILPEAGDWAIQFDATSFLNYAGNLFNSGAVAPGASWVNDQAIVGKYFVDAETAYRVKLNIGMSSVTSNAFVPDIPALVADPLSTAVVTDTRKDGATAITLGGGMEMRRGSGRLQGFYGGELLFTVASFKNTYTYGNDFVFGTGTATQFHGTDGSNDVLEQKSGSIIGLGLRGFVGCEYFIAAKISIGAEYGWGLGLVSAGEGSTTVKQTNTAGTALEDVTTASAGSSFFNLGADINGGNILGTAALVATFHF